MRMFVLAALLCASLTAGMNPAQRLNWFERMEDCVFVALLFITIPMYILYLIRPGTYRANELLRGIYEIVSVREVLRIAMCSSIGELKARFMEVPPDKNHIGSLNYCMSKVKTRSNLEISRFLLVFTFREYRYSNLSTNGRGKPYETR